MKLLQALSHLVAPRTCAVCGGSLTDSEDILCLHCLCDMPRTCEHRMDFNIIHRRLGHHCVVHRAAGWFWYVKGNRYSQLILDAKYSGLSRQARRLGAMCGTELNADGFFCGIETLVPVPMPMMKRLRRGYNQAEEICIGITSATGIPTITALKAVKAHGVQSRHSRDTRFSNIAGTMALADSAAISGKHILIVDDIITTGASVAEAIRAITPAAPASVSVLCLGLTK